MHLFKLLAVGLLGMVVGCGGGSGLKVRSPSSLASHMGSSTVALVAQGVAEDGGPVLTRVYCTGVWVSEDVILTANHCVDDEELPDGPVGLPIHYVAQGEERGVRETPAAMHLGKVMAQDKDHDLALVKAEKGGLPEHEVAMVANEMPGLGEHLFIVGHVKGLWWSYIEGVVSAYRADLPGMDWVNGPFVQVSAPVWKGNSGGGAFDSEGKLVGICSFGISAPNTNFFIHAKSIHAFMNDNMK